MPNLKPATLSKFSTQVEAHREAHRASIREIRELVHADPRSQVDGSPMMLALSALFEAESALDDAAVDLDNASSSDEAL